MKHKQANIVIGGLVAIIVVTGYYIFSLTDSGSGRALVRSESATNMHTQTVRSAIRGVESVRNEPPTESEHPSQTEKVDPAKYASNPPAAYWKRELISLASRLDLDDLEKAKRLLAKVSQLPHEGKVVAMGYATKLIPDHNYVQLRPYLFQLGSSDDLRETILVDVLTRADTIRMPTLVELLRQPPNPAQEEIREILVAYLDKDLGSDVQKWDIAVKEWLIQNPDE